jgi:hypothetical protein
VTTRRRSNRRRGTEGRLCLSAHSASWRCSRAAATADAVQRDERGKDVWRADRAAGGVARASLVRPSLRASAVEIEQLVLSELLQKQSGAGASAKANSIAPKFECLIESVCTVLTAGACVCVCVSMHAHLHSGRLEPHLPNDQRRRYEKRLSRLHRSRCEGDDLCVIHLTILSLAVTHGADGAAVRVVRHDEPAEA